VLAGCLGIILAVFYRVRASEDGTARATFVSRGEEVTAEVLRELLNGLRDLRVFASRFSGRIQVAGVLPSRGSFTGMCDDVRMNGRCVMTRTTECWWD
jgi:hypothetical protein